MAISATMSIHCCERYQTSVQKASIFYDPGIDMVKCYDEQRQTHLMFYSIFGGAGTLLYTNYYYSRYIVSEFQAFPEPVAKKLRKALWYTNIDLNPKDALGFYRQAIEAADSEGMDPLSDEILGVKFQIAAMLEKAEIPQKAIEVLEIVRNDLSKAIEIYGDNDPSQRDRLLAKSVLVCVKLGSLYASPHIQQADLAEQRLVWAVETTLKKRQELASKEKTDGWMSDEEIGGTLEGKPLFY
jgi:hypothetical protein